MKRMLQTAIISTIGLTLYLQPLQAQEPVATPVPVVISRPAAQYKVIDLARIQVPINGISATTLEDLLNDLAAQGWRVVTTSGTLIILTRGG